MTTNELKTKVLIHADLEQKCRMYDLELQFIVEIVKIFRKIQNIFE